MIRIHCEMSVTRVVYEQYTRVFNENAIFEMNVDSRWGYIENSSESESLIYGNCENGIRV